MVLFCLSFVQCDYPVLYNKEHRRHNLTTIIERFGFKCANRHRAFDDAKVLWDFLQHAHTNLEPEVLLKAMRQTLRGPRELKSKLLKAIPKMPATSLNLPIKEIIYETESGETFTL